MRGRAWSQQRFRLFFFGQGISAVGDRITSVALAFAVLDLTGSVKDLGIVLAAQTVPLVLFLLPGGVWSDRVSRRALMLASDLVRAGAQGASAALLVTGTAHVWQLVVLQAVYGTAAALFGPASQALLPQTVASADLQQANALMAISANVANVGGPAVAGVLVATIGPGWGLAFDAGTFVASAAFLALMRVQVVTPAAARTSTLSELRVGWRSFSSRTWLWSSVAILMGANAVGQSVSVLGPEVARLSLGGPAAWAAISTARGIGAVLGGAVGLRWHPRFPLRAVFAVSLLGSPALLVLLAAAAPLAALLAAAIVSGIALTLLISSGSPSYSGRSRQASFRASALGTLSFRSPPTRWVSPPPGRSQLPSASRQLSTVLPQYSFLPASRRSPFPPFATSQLRLVNQTAEAARLSSWRST
jgi:MFS family permease